MMLLATGVYAQDYSDSASGQPEITARVARISKLKGDAQIRRRDALEWEQADDNLPLVEGDELVTSKSARIEIQFDRNTYLWLDGDRRRRSVDLKIAARLVEINDLHGG